jgi:hypothetical protein
MHRTCSVIELVEGIRQRDRPLPVIRGVCKQQIHIGKAVMRHLVECCIDGTIRIGGRPVSPINAGVRVPKLLVL